ncbi:MAG: hypothetical protein FWH35_07630 [Treponema sp.]|nr:hypothetical protein [Treponema sp.]
MNTTLSTFRNTLPSYTAVGGNERRSSTGLSAVVLNRGGRYPRYTLFEDLEKAGFDYIISMEGSSSRYDLEALSNDFPFVRFILLKDTVSHGEEINLAALELSSPLFFVLWNDLRILRSGGADRMAERLLSAVGDAGNKNVYKRLCTTPLIQDGRSETMPTLIVPALLPEGNSPAKAGQKENRFAYNPKTVVKTIRFVSLGEGLPSLYPFDGIGIYDRERFVRLGGFDPSIKKFYWQLMDFGFRSNLWGEEIAVTQKIKLSYEGAFPEEDVTADESCFRFFLKNLTPVFRGDYAHIPLGRFPGYLKKRGSLSAAWEEFSAARDWVKANKYRFTSDARTLADRWVNFDVMGNSSDEKDASSSKDEM